MAFESLTEKLSSALRKISGKGKLTEANMNDMLKEVRISLLEADVNYQVVKDFIASIQEKATGAEVMKELNPGQMVVKIVREELEKLLGPEQSQIQMADSGITSIMMVGLQGTGKTTAAAKIARYAKEDLKRKVLLAACDIVRPAAIEQLKTLGKSIGVEVFSLGPETPAVYTAKCAKEYAREKGYDLVIFDTAGRLHVDSALMDELSEMKEEIQPQNILLTVDAMTGQDIISVAKEFNDRLDITGLIVTKMDSESRGGALLSVRSITSVPVLFVSNGEKTDDLEVFHPDRMASRILGMGDIESMIDEAQKKLDKDLNEQAAARMMAGVFTFNDMLAQFDQMGKLGSLSGFMGKLPGMGKLAGNLDDDKMNEEIKRYRACIQSMTPYEREHPDCLKNSRKQRIAKGAGVKMVTLNKLVEQQKQMQNFSKMLSGGFNPFGGRGFGNLRGGMPGTSKHSGSKKQKPSAKKKKKK